MGHVPYSAGIMTRRDVCVLAVCKVFLIILLFLNLFFNFVSIVEKGPCSCGPLLRMGKVEV